MNCSWYTGKWWEQLGFQIDPTRYQTGFGAGHLYDVEKNAVDIVVTGDKWYIPQSNVNGLRRQPGRVICSRSHKYPILMCVGGALGVGLAVGYYLGRR